MVTALAQSSRPRPQTSRGAWGKTPPINSSVLLAVVLGYLLLLPPQLNLTVAGAVLPPYRFFLIPAALYVIATVIRRNLQLNWMDGLMLFAGIWVAVALFNTTEPIEAFSASVAQICDMIVSYFFARCVFRSERDLRTFLIFMAPGLFLVSGVMVVESITKTHIIQPIFSALTGKSFNPYIDQRFGLLRARGPFPHAILAGLFFASFLPLYGMAGLRGWPKAAGIFSAVVSIFTFSSAALLGLVAALGLMSYNWLGQRIENLKWRLFFVMFGILIFVAELGTNSSTYSLIVRYASFNSISSYNRVLIWKYGTKNVEKNPWFGIGYAEWERPIWMKASFDHFWLLTAVRFGVIPTVLFAVVTAAAVIMLSRRSIRSNPTDALLERGIAIALAVYALGAISVALWLSAQVWFFVMIGLAVSLGTRPLVPSAPYQQVPRRVQLRQSPGGPLPAMSGQPR